MLIFAISYSLIWHPYYLCNNKGTKDTVRKEILTSDKFAEFDESV